MPKNGKAYGTTKIAATKMIIITKAVAAFPCPSLFPILTGYLRDRAERDQRLLVIIVIRRGKYGDGVKVKFPQ